MPIFELQSPDGKTYEIDAPSMDAAAAAFQGTQQQSQQPYSGSILPFSRDAQGNVGFDSNAGILGAIKRAVTLPGDVFTGKVDPRSDEAIGRSLELAGLASPVNPAIGAGERAIAGSMSPLQKPKPPTGEALKAAGSAGYKQSREMGVEYSADSVRNLAGSLRQSLEQDGIIAELAPKSFAILKKLESPPEGATAPLSGLDAARRTFRNAAKDFANPTEQLAAERAIRGLDDFVEAGDPSTVVAGPAAAAGRVLHDARANIAASKRSEKLAGLEERAERGAAVANSGQNLDNAIRQRARAILDSPKQSAGFSQQEIDLLDNVARGNIGRNTLRWLGNLLGGGGGLGAVITGGAGGLAGSAVGGPLAIAAGMAAPLAGVAAKKMGNAATTRALGRVDEASRMRSPLYEQMLRNAPPPSPAAMSPMFRAAPARSILELLLAPEQ